MKVYRLYIYYFPGYYGEGVYEIAEKSAKIKPTRWLQWMTDDTAISHCRLEVREGDINGI